MEKHKPYRCDACGKRYKNLNGLKYHKSHSPACVDGKQSTQTMDPPVIQQPSFPQAGFNVPTGMANNGLPAGLAGIDEDMVM